MNRINGITRHVDGVTAVPSLDPELVQGLLSYMVRIRRTTPVSGAVPGLPDYL
jgi:hypothetical protein